jgi:enamine deaminase RidA (YjgF/YER057c/UK114 family)
MNKQVIQPEGWPPPKGYANGIIAGGRVLYIGGQVGWDTEFRFADGFVAQFGKTLDNILEIVFAAGGAPEDVVSMTAFVTDLDAYRRSARDLGAAWRARFGRHYPAMALVGVAGLVDPRAMVEIQSIAVLPPGSVEAGE